MMRPQKYPSQQHARILTAAVLIAWPPAQAAESNLPRPASHPPRLFYLGHKSTTNSAPEPIGGKHRPKPKSIYSGYYLPNDVLGPRIHLPIETDPTTLVHPILGNAPDQPPPWSETSTERLRSLNNALSTKNQDWNSDRFFENTELKAACIILERMKGKTATEVLASIGPPTLMLGSKQGEFEPKPPDADTRFWYVLGTTPAFLYLDFRDGKCTDGLILKWYTDQDYLHWRFIQSQKSAGHKTPLEIIKEQGYPDQITTKTPPPWGASKKELEKYFDQNDFSGILSFFKDGRYSFEFTNGKCVRAFEGPVTVTVGRSPDMYDSNATFIPVEKSTWRECFKKP